MTEDMHEERMQAVQALGDSFVSSKFLVSSFYQKQAIIMLMMAQFQYNCLQSFSAQLEREILLSGMNALPCKFH